MTSTFTMTKASRHTHSYLNCKKIQKENHTTLQQRVKTIESERAKYNSDACVIIMHN